MAELTFEKKRVSRHRHIFSSSADVAEVLALVKSANIPGELRVGLPGNGGVNFIEFVDKEKTETVYYEPDESK
jgi:hypothetical protein